jgi:hypothetical protein
MSSTAKEIQWFKKYMNNCRTLFMVVKGWVKGEGLVKGW